MARLTQKMSKSLTIKDDYRIELITEEDTKEVLDFLKRFFFKVMVVFSLNIFLRFSTMGPCSQSFISTISRCLHFTLCDVIVRLSILDASGRLIQFDYTVCLNKR